MRLRADGGNLTRRDLLAGASGALLTRNGRIGWQFGVEAYIFQQYTQRNRKQLGDVLPEVMGMVKDAGFRNLELNASFLTAALKPTTLDLVRSNGLRMPSVYSGGAMHEEFLVKKTIEDAIQIGRECQPFGCSAVVFNSNPKGEGIEKTDSELAFQAQALNRLGRLLLADGLQLRVHNHTPEMINDAREWRSTLKNTDPKLVSFCLDLDWVHQGGQDPLALLEEAGNRVHEIHVRNSRNKLWSEELGDGDIDYRKIVQYLEKANRKPYVVVELAYRENTAVTRSLEEDLRRSRAYAEKLFV